VSQLVVLSSFVRRHDELADVFLPNYLLAWLIYRLLRRRKMEANPCVHFFVCRMDGDNLLLAKRAGSVNVSIDACGRNIVMKES
jgi:hypothetical protein